MEPSIAANRTMPYNADATNDENETMPLKFSCKQRRTAKLNNFRRSGTTATALNMTEHCTTYDNMAESSQVVANLQNSQKTVVDAPK